LHYHLAATLVIASGLLLLTGCQSLSGGTNGSGASGNVVVTVPTLDFGTVVVGSSKTLPDALTNNSTSTVTISSIQGLSTGFHVTGISLPLALAAGQSAAFSVQYLPSAAGDSNTTISLVGPNAQPLVSLTATATAVASGALTANPTSLAFGSIGVGSNSSLSETLTNTSNSSVTITAATVSGTGFSLGTLSLPVSLAANHSVTFTVVFTPASAVAASGNISVASDASNPTLNIPLSGTGTATTGTLAVSPTSLSFGNVVDGSSLQLTGKLTATGAPVTVSTGSITGTNSNEFALSGISLPVTISAGQFATFTVTFTPGASGAATASLSFASNASNTPTVQSLTGTGTVASQHYVDLTWAVSTGAVGYNIYRGTVSGGPYLTKLNTALNATSAFTDNAVAGGQTYYYVTTAVDSNSVESGYSNQAQADIPTS